MIYALLSFTWFAAAATERNENLCGNKPPVGDCNRDMNMGFVGHQMGNRHRIKSVMKLDVSARVGW